jgi:hypothetical protein
MADAPQRFQPRFLIHFFGSRPVAPHEVEDESIHLVQMPIDYGTPRAPVASLQTGNQAGRFVVGHSGSLGARWFIHSIFARRRKILRTIRESVALLEPSMEPVASMPPYKAATGGRAGRRFCPSQRLRFFGKQSR